MAVQLRDDELLAIYDILFIRTHSDSFKKREIKDLLYDKHYSFLEMPQDGWRDKLKAYFESRGIDQESFKDSVINR